MSETEAMVTSALNAMLERACMVAGDEVAFGIILSRVTRELRRSFGVAGAQTFLLNFVATLPSIQSDGEVVVPSADYRMGENERVIWIMTQVIIAHARRLLRDDRCMFTLLLDGVARQMGDSARPILIGFEETMAEAAEYDR